MDGVQSAGGHRLARGRWESELPWPSARGHGVVVTGAAGFIGSHLVDGLLAAGHTVTGIDDFDPWYNPEQKYWNLTEALAHPQFRLERIHLGDRAVGDRLADLLTGAQAVYHLAGRPGVQDSWGPGFGQSVERNILVTQQLYEAALAAGVERVVYASSSSVYGNGSSAGSRGVAAPVSPYGVAKLAGENLAAVYRARGLSVTSLRYFTVYGPRQRPDMAMHRLFEACRANGPTFVLRGDGTQQREFTYVGDVVAATMAAGSATAAADATIDVGGGSSVSLNQIVGLVEHLEGTPVRMRSLPAPAGDPAITEADHREALDRLNWAPSIGLEQGLALQAAWHRELSRVSARWVSSAAT